MIYGLKNGSYAVIYTAAQTVANKAASSVDNDAVRGVRQAQYYASIAGNTLYALRHLDVTKDLKKDIQWSKADKTFLHSRKLEQEILDAYQSTGKWQLSSSKVTRISYEFLELKRQMLRDQFGSLADLSDRKLQEEIQRLLTDSRILKSRVLRLEAKGSALTPEERKQLLQLRKKLKEMGQNIGLRKRAIQSKADFRFQEKKIHHIQDIANRNRRGVMSQLQLLRTIVLTPLRSGLDSQTDGLGYAVSIATNRTVHRVVKGAAKTSFAALKLSGRGLWWAAGKAAPGVTIAAEAGAQTAKAQIRHSVHGLKAGAQKGAAFVGRTISNAVPTSIKSTAYAVHRQYKAVQTGVKTAISATKHLAASAPAGKAYTSVRLAGRKAANAVKEGLLLLKALLGKVALFAGGGLLTLILMTGFLMVIVSIIGGSMITAPYESGGKIDLSPYTQILRQEMSSFTGRLEELVAAYQENPSYNRVDLAYHGTRNNFREILSMMAVRLEQDLSIEDNPNVEAYLADLFDSSTSYTLSERRYYCSGCKEREVISEDPVTGDPITEIETYCPGHIDVTIDVQILSFDEIFDVDHFDPSDASWDGWTEENREWAVRIYNMDWAELYTGVDLFSQGSADFGTVTSSPQERYIWNYLVRLTGSEYAAAGIMGNLYAESGLIPNNLQDEYEASLGYTDEGYTQAVDNGTYSGFSSDSAGYGLVQWTYPDRKERLLALARERGTSIGDLTTQLEMVSLELTGTPILEDLKNASSVPEASDIVMLRYERPANQSAEARQRRTSYSQYFYNKMVHGIASEGELTEKQMEVIRIATNSGSYGISAVQGYCQAWAADVYEAAGLPRDGSCCAYHSGMSYGVSSDWSVIPPGAAVYGYAGQQYGHVGIYVGNGLVYHNIGGVAIDTLSDWISYYDGFAWGWEGGADLTTFD